ncbi:MAG: PspC domain-containing protein [Pseudomonadota bacterium]
MTTRTQIFKLLRSLYLDRENAWMAGVCAGLADRFDVDVNILRALTAAAAWFMTLPVVMLYALAAFLLSDKPLEPRNPRDERNFWRTRNHHRSF